MKGSQMEESKKQKQFYSDEDLSEMERLQKLYTEVNLKVKPESRKLIDGYLQDMALLNSSLVDGISDKEYSDISDRLAACRIRIKEIDPEFYKLIVPDEM